MFDVADAIEATAGSECLPSHRNFASPIASARAVERTKRTILRFLENVPDDLCIFEVRRAIEDLEDADRISPI